MRWTLRPTGKRSIYVLFITLFIIFLILCYMFLIRRKYTEVFEVVFEDVEPKTVWEFWSDFSKWQTVNPTTEDFEIEFERGTYENWEYGVSYFERLSMFPLITNSYRGVFKITPEKKVGHFTQPFRIDSEHWTCFSVFCLHTDADMTFTAISISQPGKGPRHQAGNTKVIEVINFECIPLLAPLCRRELRSQRNLIFNKAKQIDFSSFNVLYEGSSKSSEKRLENK